MKIVGKLKKLVEKGVRNTFLSGLLFKNKPVILTDAYGMRFVLYPWMHEPLEKLLSRRYLVSEYEAISKLIKSGDTVIDIGANVGTHSVFMSRIVGEKGIVYAFEPVPETSWQLKENLALNKIENVTSVTAAASAEDGTQNMNIFPINFSAWNSFGIPDTKESRIVETTPVKTVKLDTFVKEKNIQHIHFLKIDAEGSEEKVLEGAKDILSSGMVDVFSFEVSEIPLEGTGGTSQDIFNLVESYGYNIYRYDGRAKKFMFGKSKNQCENYYASKSNLKSL